LFSQSRKEDLHNSPEHHWGAHAKFDSKHFSHFVAWKVINIQKQLKLHYGPIVAAVVATGC